MTLIDPNEPNEHDGLWWIPVLAIAALFPCIIYLKASV